MSENKTRSKIAKRSEWTKRLARFQKSNQSVAQFCSDEGLSVPSFYYWRKILLSPPTGAPEAPSGFQPVQVVSALTTSCGQPTIVRLGHGMEIELGSDLAVVKAVVHQLLEATHAGGGESC